MSYVYLLHFEQPIAPGRHTTQHYIGKADDLAQRIAAHARGRYNGGGNGCAKLCAVAKGRGIGFRVVRVWRGGRALETRIKARKNAPALCPICGRGYALRDVEEIPAADISRYLDGIEVRR